MVLQVLLQALKDGQVLSVKLRSDVFVGWGQAIAHHPIRDEVAVFLQLVVGALWSKRATKVFFHKAQILFKQPAVLPGQIQQTLTAQKLHHVHECALGGRARYGGILWEFGLQMIEYLDTVLYHQTVRREQLGNAM